MIAVIPCKRPKVVVEPRTEKPGEDRYDAYCRVPGCSWTYPTDKQFMALKSDAEARATMHRREHRAAVPSVSITRENGHPYRVKCSCGLDRCDGATTTRIDAEGVRDFHMTGDHGLVTCP